MITQPSLNGAEFDEFSADYDGALDSGLSVSGEKKDYFARGRIAWLAQCLGRLRERPERLLDYGCGTGSAVPFMLDLLEPRSILGIDISTKSLERARRSWGSDRVRFACFDDFHPNERTDLAFCNGVFHHIPVSERRLKLNEVSGLLRPGGLFAFWENNPWNPGTRYVMSRIPFDHAAIPISAPQARRMLRAAGFDILSTHFLFIFPRTLKWLRPIEPYLSPLPLGAQYQVLCRKR